MGLLLSLMGFNFNNFNRISLFVVKLFEFEYSWMKALLREKNKDVRTKKTKIIVISRSDNYQLIPSEATAL